MVGGDSFFSVEGPKWRWPPVPKAFSSPRGCHRQHHHQPFWREVPLEAKQIWSLQHKIQRFESAFELIPPRGWLRQHDLHYCDFRFQRYHIQRFKKRVFVKKKSSSTGTDEQRSSSGEHCSYVASINEHADISSTAVPTTDIHSSSYSLSDFAKIFSSSSSNCGIPFFPKDSVVCWSICWRKVPTTLSFNDTHPAMVVQFKQSSGCISSRSTSRSWRILVLDAVRLWVLQSTFHSGESPLAHNPFF